MLLLLVFAWLVICLFVFPVVLELLLKALISIADPQSMSAQKALETIGGGLQKQYERWRPRARYKQSLDPTVDEVKKLCMSLRRNAKVIIFFTFNKYLPV